MMQHLFPTYTFTIYQIVSCWFRARCCRIFVFALFSAATLLTIIAPVSRVSADSRVTVFIPIAVNRSNECALTANERQIEQQMVTAPDQRRATLMCNAILTQVARERARDMATRNYFGHTNPDGYGPNYLVREAGYPLPDYYSSAPDGNNIESIAAGHPSGMEAWSSWMKSPPHKEHLLGETEFYAEQIDYGIGHVYVGHGNTYKHYWVVLTAKSSVD
jgi:hypothetical protein